MEIVKFDIGIQKKFLSVVVKLLSKGHVVNSVELIVFCESF